MSKLPLCFVLMPFGKKPSVAGSMINFDAIYKRVIAPAITAAELQPLRADEEMTGGIIHKPMFERLILCEFAVADLTNANANVFYELGLRHAVRPWSTVLIFAEGGPQLPFDVAPLRAMAYRLAPDGAPVEAESFKTALTRRLLEARKAVDEMETVPADSPVYQLVEGYPDVAHRKTDEFREKVDYAAEIKEKLAAARRAGLDALRAVEAELGNLKRQEFGVIIDLYLSYRAVEGWTEMIELVKKMPPPLAGSVLVQEQLAFALNRAGRGEDAERVLLELIENRGPSSETYGLLGRVYKDRWEAAKERGAPVEAEGLLNRAIDAYLKGFETDWRDAYPGINAVTLMEVKASPDPRRRQLLPVVTYAVDRRIAAGKPDYWDHATRLELAVLAKNRSKSKTALADALAAVRENWEPKTTLRNLRLIREAREQRNEPVDWMAEIEAALEKRTQA